MTRMSWTHSRSRTRSGDDSTQGASSRQWFSRTSGEPSRQALTDLVKEHQRGQSQSSSSSQGSRASNTRSTGSRGKNVTSVNWDYDRSRPATVLEVSSRSASPTSPTREGSIISTLDRPGSAARGLFNKGSQILKSKGSIMSLSSFSSTSMLGLNIPLRTSSVQGQTSPVTPSLLKGENLRKAISPPFAFQHVTHTEQAQFRALKGIEPSDLTFQFNDATSHQSANTELMGIKADDIPRSQSNRTPDVLSDIESTHRLPRTPPRPSPPPKDSPKGLLPPVRLSPQGSLDLFFDSGRSSPVSETETTPIDLGHPHQSETMPSLDSKPLPQIPEVMPEIIHAVSTTDDSARLMKVAPLPSVPHSASNSVSAPISRKRASHHYRKSSATLRHMSTFPAPDQTWPHESLDMPNSATNKPLTRHRSDLELFQQARLSKTPAERPISVGLKPIDTLNWEDAVDDAWDYPVDEPDNLPPIRQGGLRASALPRGVIYEDEIPEHDQQNDSQSVDVPYRLDATESLANQRQDSRVHDDSLLGLGIHGSLAGPDHDANSNTRLIHESGVGMLSKSSSQESIILSIASSILGTYRSSNSSVHSDYNRAARLDNSPSHSTLDLSPFIIQSSPLVPQDRRTSARPESGCLPVAVKSPTLAVEAVAEESAEDTVPSLPVPKRTATKHRHAASAPRVEVPERRSSIIASPNKTRPRQRANTLGSGARASASAGISYSLFPTPPPNQRIITKS